MLAVLIESRTPTRAELTALLVLTIGVMLSVWEGAKGSSRGITYAVMGTISNAVRGFVWDGGVLICVRCVANW